VLARQLIDLSRPHPFHGGGQLGVQCVHQHAAEGHTRRPYPDGRLDSLHHGVWWHWM
jgi:hypothetical protein